MQRWELSNNLKRSFFGKYFVFTGSLDHYTRNAAHGLVEILSGGFDREVTTRTTHIVVGDSPGAKLTKAQARNIVILNEAEFEAEVLNCFADKATVRAFNTYKTIENKTVFIRKFKFDE